MRVVSVGELEPVREHLVAQCVGPVDANMPTFVGVVGIRKSPADPLRKPAWDRDRQSTTGFEDPNQFGDRLVVLRDVLEDLGGDDTVERAVGVGQIKSITLDHFAFRRGGRLTLLLHRLQDLVDIVEIRDVLVEADHVGAAPERFEGMTARAAADVDHLGSGADPEAVEVHGQHVATLSRARSYTATVCAATDSQLNTSSARRRPLSPSLRSSIGESSSSPST